MFLDGVDQGLVARQRFHRIGQQDAFDIDRHAGLLRGRFRNDPAQRGLDFGRIFLGNHAAIELEADAARNHVGVGAAFDQPDVQIGVRDTFDRRAHLLVQRVLCVQGVEDAHGGLQGINARVGDGRVRHLAVDRDLHLQAAVVRGDDLVAEAGGNHQVRVNHFVPEQPARADLATKLLVVGEQQFDLPSLRSGHGFQRPHRKRVGRKVTLADRSRAAVDLSVFDFAAIGVVGPALARRDHIAVRIEQHGATGPVGAAHHEVGDALQPRSSHVGLRHRVFFGIQAHGAQQVGGTVGVWRIVARWRVGGHADQFLQKAHLLVKVRVHPAVELFVGVHGDWSGGG